MLFFGGFVDYPDFLFVVVDACAIDPAGATFGGFDFDPGFVGDAVAEVDLLGGVGDFVHEEDFFAEGQAIYDGGVEAWFGAHIEAVYGYIEFGVFAELRLYFCYEMPGSVLCYRIHAHGVRLGNFTGGVGQPVRGFAAAATFGNDPNDDGQQKDEQ